jgi:hypothetical protein
MGGTGMEQMTKLGLMLAGLFIGYALSDREKFMGRVANSVFAWILPYVVIVEVSSHSLHEWWYFLYGAAFVLGLYYLARSLGWNKNQSALFATAEGGTIGFVLYVYIGTQPISWFFLIDMLGNGGVLFSFIYWQVGREYKFKSFLQNRLIIGMGLGLLLNIIAMVSGISKMHLLEFSFISVIEPYAVMTIVLLVSMVVGSKIHLPTGRDIFFSPEYRRFWTGRIAIGIAALTFKLPLAVTILAVLPPSFLLPVIYKESCQEDDEKYVSNFIAASLPVSLVLMAILAWRLS